MGLTGTLSGMKDIAVDPLTFSSAADPRWDLARRVADSLHFRKGPKLRTFLLYVCENALLGRLDNIREQLIGAEVFGRPVDYNIYGDNIVRVEARELRKRLEAYFAREGRHEPIVIEIPKGAYVPVFRRREELEAPPMSHAEHTPEELAPPPELPHPETQVLPVGVAAAGTGLHARPRPVLWLAIGLVLCALVIGWLSAVTWRLRHPVYSAGAGPLVSAQDFSMYADLLGSLGAGTEREPQLVLSNPQTITFYGSESSAHSENVSGPAIPAPKDLKTRFGFALRSTDRDLPFLFLGVNREGFTGVGEAVAAFHLGRLMQALRRPVRLTQSRFLNWDRVQKQDLILLGGPSSNDWSYQNDSKANFVFVPRQGLQNLKPLPGEPRQYHSEPLMPGKAVAQYGVVQMLTSPYGFRTLMLAGEASPATAGVAEYFSNPERITEAYRLIRAAAPGKAFPPDWEMVLKIAVRDNIPVASSAVAVRPAVPR